MSAPPGKVQVIDDLALANVVLHDMRLQLLELAQSPMSSAAMANELGLPRQRVNYHVQALAKNGLLRKAGKRRRRNMVEQRYMASAQSYILCPSLLGPVAVDWEATASIAGTVRGVALVNAHLLSMLQTSRRASLVGGLEYRFSNAQQRTRFVGRLRQTLRSLTNASRRYRSGRHKLRLLLAAQPD